MAKSPAQWYEDLDTGPEYQSERLKLDFACVIEQRMRAIGIRKTVLAQRAGITPGRLDRILRGDADVHLATLARLAHEVGCEIHIRLAPTQES